MKFSLPVRFQRDFSYGTYDVKDVILNNNSQNFPTENSGFYIAAPYSTSLNGEDITPKHSLGKTSL